MSPFGLLIDYDVVQFLEKLPRSARQSVRYRLQQIRDHPAAHSDCTETDSTGRRVEINICGAYAIKYWVDHADRQIKVLDVHRADRRK